MNTLLTWNSQQIVLYWSLNLLTILSTSVVELGSKGADNKYKTYNQFIIDSKNFNICTMNIKSLTLKAMESNESFEFAIRHVI